MNGFEVFRFTRNVVPRLIKNYLGGIGKGLDSFELLALHQASELVVASICKTLKFDNESIANFACGEIGNLGAGSIGAWLSQGKSLVNKENLNMLVVGYGAGLSWGAASLQVSLQINEVIYV